MLRNTADCEADAKRFIERIVGTEVVWHLVSDGHVAYCESTESDDSEDPSTVLLFFSDEAYAKRAQQSHFPEHAARSIDLFDFLYRWLPGMTDDGALAGPNWSGELVGLEFEPYPLRERIESMMSKAHLARYETRYRSLTSRAD